MSRTVRRSLLLSTLVLLLTALPVLAVTPAGDALQVNVPSPYWQVSPTAAAMGDGVFLVAWEDMRDGIRGRFVDAAGAPLGGELDLVANTPFPEVSAVVTDYVSTHAPELLALPDGGFYLFWTEKTSTLRYDWFHSSTFVHAQEIFGRRFTAAGAPAADRFRVNAVAAGFQDRPQATLLSDGRLAVAWQEIPDADSEAVRVELRFVADGAPVGVDHRVSTAPASPAARPQVSPLAGGGALVVWIGSDGDGTGLLARALDSAGLATGAPAGVNVVETGYQGSPVLASGADGRYLVGWQHRVPGESREYRIRGRFLDAAGAPVGGELQLTDEVAEMDGAPSLVGLPDGGYMAFWLGWAKDMPQWIIGQHLDAAGAPDGPPIQVSSDRPQPQHVLGTALGDSALFVTWEGQDGFTHGVSGRSFDVAQPVTVLSVQAAGSD